VHAIPTTQPVVGVAWGLDLAAPALLVAQRGFSGLVCNEMADLARWRRSGGGSVLLVADHVVATLIEREHASGGSVSIGVAVPGWFGALECHHLIDRLTHGITPDVGVTVTLISATVCLAIGSNRAAVCAGSAPANEVVLAVDAGIGWSAAVVQVADDEVREVAGVSVEPGRPVERTRLLRALLDAASGNGGAPVIERVVVIGGADEHELLEEPVAELLGGAEAPRIGVVATRRTTSAGAMVLADPAADLRGGGTLLPGWVPSSIRQPSWAPSTTVLPMPIGDEASPESAARGDTEPGDMSAGGMQPSDTFPDDGVAAVAVASATVAVAVAGLIRSPAGVGHDPQVSPAPSAGDESFLIAPPSTADGVVPPAEPDAVTEAGEPVEAVEAPRVRHSNPGALAEVLQHCERLLSFEVDALVAVRSVPALLGCSDDAADDELRASAARLRALGVRRGDELGEVLVAAADESLRCLADDPAHRYVAGTLADVAVEVAQVVEHLRVVVGVVAPAERRRLVRDAMLLGPETAVAIDVVDRVLGSVGDARHDPLPGSATLDVAGWLTSAVWSLPDDRFVLAGSMQAGSMQAGSIAIRVVLEI
jgi:hypothetical protein